MIDAVRARLDSLTEDQAAEVLRVLFAQVSDGEPLLTDAEMMQREHADRAYVEELQEGLRMPAPPEARSARIVLLALYDNVQDIREPIGEALEQAALDQETLDFGVSALLTVLVLGVATAIMRPRVSVEKKTEGDRSESKVVVEARGISNIEDVVRALLPFLH